MMQENEFSPNSQVVNITSGYEFIISVDAKRVAYSFYGFKQLKCKRKLFKAKFLFHNTLILQFYALKIA
jgi:hypothetical protein